LNPREREIAFTEIAAAMADELHVAAPADPLAGARTFFRVFQQQLRVFPDAIPTLRALRERGQPIGVFTDVPYGMPRALVVDDVAATGLTALIDVLITSGDAGWRKPSPQSLRALADALGCEVTGLVYVGDERKDIAAALASGCRSVLLDRAGVAPAWGQHATVRNLQELLTLT
jgi:HAD superfamily hydrolase (TIGR01509 family)